MKVFLNYRLNLTTFTVKLVGQGQSYSRIWVLRLYPANLQTISLHPVALSSGKEL